MFSKICSSVRNFDPNEEAQLLHAAFNDAHVNSPFVVDILAQRIFLQRMKIAQSYQSLYGHSIVDDLHAKLKGNVRKTALALMTTLQRNYTQFLYNAINDRDYGVVIEILCVLNNEDLKKIRDLYKEIYKIKVKDHLANNFSLNEFGLFLIFLSQGKRSKDASIDYEKAKEDAVSLVNSTQTGFVDLTLFDILKNRSYIQLRYILAEYQKLAGLSMEIAIKREYTGPIQKLLVAIVKCANSKQEFLADQLQQGFEGFESSDNTTFLRIIVFRYEIDTEIILKIFTEKYGISFRDWSTMIASDDLKNSILPLMYMNPHLN